MKAIIDGKRYDTDTATEIADYRNTYDTGDFAWYCETLYRTRRGNFFLAGVGNASSPYCKRVAQNEWGGGSAIKPLTPDEAREWLAGHADPEILEEHFGDSIEDA